jgi:hypothetical protein
MSKKADRRKESVIAGLVKTRREILEGAVTIPVERRDAAFVGVWSIQDLLAHLAGWDYTNLEGVQALLKGEVPGFFASHDRDWKTFNAALVASHRRDDLTEMIAIVQKSQSELVAFLDTLSDEDFLRVVRVNTFRMSIGALLNFEIRDEKVHLEQIRQFLIAGEG